MLRGHVSQAAGTLPARGSSLAVTGERVYVPDPAGSAVWVLDRRRGTLAPPIPVGHRPIGVALASRS